MKITKTPFNVGQKIMIMKKNGKHKNGVVLLSRTKRVKVRYITPSGKRNKWFPVEELHI